MITEKARAYYGMVATLRKLGLKEAWLGWPERKLHLM